MRRRNFRPSELDTYCFGDASGAPNTYASADQDMESLDRPVGNGSFLGEFSLGDIGTALIDESKRGATTIRLTKTGGTKRLSKSQREALERDGKTPPMDIKTNPAKGHRNATLSEDGTPKQRKTRERVPKEGQIGGEINHMKERMPGEIKGGTENVLSLLKPRTGRKDDNSAKDS